MTRAQCPDLGIIYPRMTNPVYATKLNFYPFLRSEKSTLELELK